MKSLIKYVQENMENTEVKKVYHLSYDIINTKDEKEYSKYLESLNSLIESTNPYVFDSVCESTYIIAYKNDKTDLIQVIKNNLKSKNHYTLFISKIHKNVDGTFETIF